MKHGRAIEGGVGTRRRYVAALLSLFVTLPTVALAAPGTSSKAPDGGDVLRGPSPQDTSSSRVDAGSKRSKARSLASKAFVALDGGSYANAVTHFSDAIALFDVPTLRLGRANAYFALGKWREAMSDCEAAIAYELQPGDSATLAASRVTATTRLQEIEKRIPKLRLRTTGDDADVVVDESPAVRVSDGALLPVNPGSHRVNVTTSGRSVTHSIEATEGQVVTVLGPQQPTIVTLAAPPKVSRAPKPAPVSLPAEVSVTDSETPTERIVATSVTCALAVATVVTGVMFFDAKRRYDAVNADDSLTELDANRSREEAEAYLPPLIGLATATVVSAGVTTYFWAAPQFADDRPGRAPHPSGLTGVIPSGVWVGAAGRF